MFVCGSFFLFYHSFFYMFAVRIPWPFEILFPEFCNLFTGFSIVIIFSLRMSLPHIPVDFILDVKVFKFCFFALVFRWCAEMYNSSSGLKIGTCSSACRIVFNLCLLYTWLLPIVFHSLTICCSDHYRYYKIEMPWLLIL